MPSVRKGGHERHHKPLRPLFCPSLMFSMPFYIAGIFHMAGTSNRFNQVNRRKKAKPYFYHYENPDH
jgi:hypothetical protein